MGSQKRNIIPEWNSKTLSPENFPKERLPPILILAQDFIILVIM